MSALIGTWILLDFDKDVVSGGICAIILICVVPWTLEPVILICKIKGNIVQNVQFTTGHDTFYFDHRFYHLVIPITYCRISVCLQLSLLCITLSSVLKGWKLTEPWATMSDYFDQISTCSECRERAENSLYRLTYSLIFAHIDFINCNYINYVITVFIQGTETTRWVFWHFGISGRLRWSK